MRAQRPPADSFFSTTVTRIPDRARWAAAVRPPAPAPITITFLGFMPCLLRNDLGIANLLCDAGPAPCATRRQPEWTAARAPEQTDARSDVPRPCAVRFLKQAGQVSTRYGY